MTNTRICKINRYIYKTSLKPKQTQKLSIEALLSY